MNAKGLLDVNHFAAPAVEIPSKIAGRTEAIRIATITTRDTLSSSDQCQRISISEVDEQYLMVVSHPRDAPSVPKI